MARFLIAEIVDVIDHLHRHHIVYRDLKPENVLIQRDGHILLIDFGLAKILNERVEQTFDDVKPQMGRRRGATTQTYCGTEEYMGVISLFVECLSSLSSFTRYPSFLSLSLPLLLFSPAAPEVMVGKAYGKAVDWWNVGYLFYVMLVGDHPFKADSPYETQRKTLAVCLSFRP